MSENMKYIRLPITKDRTLSLGKEVIININFISAITSIERYTWVSLSNGNSYPTDIKQIDVINLILNAYEV